MKPKRLPDPVPWPYSVASGVLAGIVVPPQLWLSVHLFGTMTTGAGLKFVMAYWWDKARGRGGHDYIFTDVRLPVLTSAVVAIVRRRTAVADKDTTSKPIDV